MMKRFILALATGVALLLPPLLHAAPDEMQKQIVQKAIDAQRKFTQDQAVQSTKRAQLLQDHMRIMNDSMSQMQAARLRGGATAQDQHEWFIEHQKLMDATMGQMRDSHLALTQIGCW